MALMTVVAAATADVYQFNRLEKYRIESVYAGGSSVALGANHNVNSPLCVTTTDTLAADCWWYLIEQSSGRYYIVNASTGQYVTFDNNYSNSPILRYIHLSDQAEGNASIWTVAYYVTASNDSVFYMQSVENSLYYFNLRTSSFALGAYDNGSMPTSSNGLFRIYNSKNYNVLTGEYGGDKSKQNDDDDDDNKDIKDTIVIDSAATMEPIVGEVEYVYRADGKVDAVPRAYLDSILETRDSIIISTLDSTIRFAYARFEVDSVSQVCPSLPMFNSFKFNDKYNPHIIDDAPAEVDGDSLLLLSVVGIGKTLRPSFQLDDDFQAFIGDSVQQSKVTRVRFAHDVVYTVARRGQTILRRNLLGQYKVMPLGREVTVRVDFLTDHSTSQYNVPTIYLTTDDGLAITSKTRWKTGTVRIDGAGVFPDLPETAMQIKGRGNTSWGASKKPYHMKFDTSTKVLGLKKGKHWNLIANSQRLSMTTNAIAMKMAQMVEAAGANHEIPVELYLNGEYRGSYNLTENIGFRNNSIDLDDETYATMLELDSYYDDTYKFRDNSYNLPVNIKEPDFSDTGLQITLQEVKDLFNSATKALADGDLYGTYVDFDYMARFLFVDEFSANFELMHPKSTFLYNANIHDSDSKFIYGPVWDFDWAFGYSGGGHYFNKYSTVDYWERSGGNGQPWARAQRYNSSAFDRVYYKTWYDFMKGGCLQELIDFCDDYYRFAAPSFTHDNTIWNHGDASDYADITTSSKAWLKERADYVMTYMGDSLGYNRLGYANSTSRRPTVGDVNGDGVVSTADLVCVLNYILGLPNADFDFGQADTDHNNIITVADLINVRNRLPVSQRSAQFYSLPEADARVSAGDVEYGTEGITVPLYVNVDEGKYSGLQFDLKIPAGMTVDNLDISSAIPDFDVSVAALDNAGYRDQSIDRYRVSIYSGANHLLPQGKSNLTLSLGWGSTARTTDLLAVSLSDISFATSLGEDERTSSAAAQFVSGDLTGIGSAVALVGQEGNKLTFRATENSVLPIYGVDGRLYRLYKLSAGTEQISLPLGIYIINKQKIVVH